MGNQKKEIKTIGMGFVGKLFGWIIGIIFILIGFMILYRGLASGLFGKLFLPGILFILSGFILTPVFNLILIKMFKIQFSGWVRFFIFISLIIFASILTILAVNPVIEEARENYNNNQSIGENSSEAIKKIEASIGEVLLEDNLLSFKVIVENRGNVKVSFKVISLFFKDSKDKEVYSVNTSYEEILTLSPGDISRTEMKVENWNSGNYTVSANVLDLEGDILASAEKQFYV